jgi:hypothetical protein
MGDWFDGKYEYSPSESRLYIDIDEDDEPESLILGGIFLSVEYLFFSILDFYLSTSLSI